MDKVEMGKSEMEKSKTGKLKMRTENIADANFAALSHMFPNAVTETIDENGEKIRAIDADKLAQEINTRVISGMEERYQFTWPDKRKSVVLANMPIAAALRPCREESVDFDNTENLYIEGDNLDVLKLLRETYLNRVKMIYIDPPYNTGKEFVYEDDFTESAADYVARSGDYDEQGNRLVKNTEANGRFHTDWLNMIYPRLRLAKDLLSDDGVIFISIDDNEVHNLRKVCDEIFGERNFVGCCIRRTINSGKNDVKTISVFHEYLFIYSKNMDKIRLRQKEKSEEERIRLYKESDDYIESRGRFYLTQLNKNSIQYSDSLNYPILGPDGVEIWPGEGFHDKKWCWRWSSKKVQWGISQGMIVFKATRSGKYKVYTKSYELMDNDGNTISRQNPYNSLEFTGKEYANFNATPELSVLFDGEKIFNFPKSETFIREILRLGSLSSNSLILDFFSGSATTAHAVMQLNAEDGGNRKYIMVQIQELTNEKSEATKAGYKNICEIGKERIRRAAEKIRTENPDAKFDGGFRVLKLDSSNMKEVYYTPDEYTQQDFYLDGLTDNIKEDRSDEDLLFQVMLDLGIPLSAKITRDNNLLCVNDNYLIACFERVDIALITKIAKRKPHYAVFRDGSFTNDAVLSNFEQVFKTHSPNTIRRIL